MNPHGDTTGKEALIELCKNGDRQALGSLYSTYAQRMMRVVCHYVDDWQAAQDVLHDGFLIIFSRIGQLRNADSLEYWMATIMKNLALQYLREADITCLLDDDFEAMDVPEFEQSITMEQLEVMINRLPLGYRRVFRLAVLEHKTHKEIAKILGISEQTSGSQLYHARILLRRMINEYRVQAGMLAIIAVLGIGLWLWLRPGNDTPTRSTLISDTRKPPGGHPPLGGQASPPAIKTEGVPSPPAIKDTQALFPTVEDEHIPAVKDEVEIIPVDTASHDTLHYRLIEPEEQYIARQPVEELQHSDPQDFEVTLAGTFSPGRQNGDAWMIPGNPNTNEPGYSVDEDVDYHLPISVELSVAKALGSRWSASAGLRYTLHRTDRTLQYQSASGTSWVENQNISAHYLGVPLAVRYRALTTGRFSLHATAGVAVEFPLHATMTRRFTTTATTPSGILDQPAKLSFRPPVLYSFSTGVTLQYRITPVLSISMQPTATYTIPASAPYPLLPTSRPWSFSIPVGLTITPK